MERLERVAVEGMEGVWLRVEAQAKQPIPLPKVKKFYVLARNLNRLRQRIQRLSEQENRIRKEIIDLAMSFGVKGIISEGDNFLLSIVVREKVLSWDREKLKELLGEAYEAVVKEELKIRIMLPLRVDKTLISDAEVLSSIFNALKNLGIKEPEKIVESSIEVIVDEERLPTPLPPGVKTSQTIWQIRTEALRPSAS